MKPMLPLVLLILGVSSALASSSFADMTLERVMVVHRHGARTALLECRTQMCKELVEPDGPGVLTVEGKVMLFQLGRHLRQTYNGSLPQSYDPRRFYSRAADEGRTIQSGIAFLKGLFCDHFEQQGKDAPPACSQSGFGSVLYPGVHTMQKHEDLYLDAWGGMPVLGLRIHVGEPAKYAYMNPLVQSVWSNHTMRKLAAETGFGSECPESPYDCLGDAVDFGKYAESRGILETQYPVLHKLLPTANWLWGVGNNYTYHGPLQHPSRVAPNLTKGNGDVPSIKVQTGNMGYPLAKELARNARGVLLASDHSSFNAGTDMRHSFDQNPDLVHYSGHDVTLIPLTSALGNDTVAINPPFGAALVVEVWNRTSTGQLFVKAHYGQPANPDLNVANQSLQDNFHYNFEPYGLWCTTPSGTTYQSLDGDDGCVLEDWERFIDLHAAPSHLLQAAFGGGSGEERLDFSLPVGGTIYCSALASDLEAIGCSPTQDPSIPVVPGSHCWNYRRRCPIMACAFVRLSDGQLVRTGHLQMNLTCA